MITRVNPEKITRKKHFSALWTKILYVRFTCVLRTIYVYYDCVFTDFYDEKVYKIRTKEIGKFSCIFLTGNFEIIECAKFPSNCHSMIHHNIPLFALRSIRDVINLNMFSYSFSYLHSLFLLLLINALRLQNFIIKA